MAFSKANCVKLLREVNSTQVSIESASAKILFWKKNAKEVVHYWDEVFRESSPQKKLDLVYVANDLLQKSRQISREFTEEFFKVLPVALKHLLKHVDLKSQQKIKRVVDIWRDREVFGRTATKTFQALVAHIPKASAKGDSQSAPSPGVVPRQAASSESAVLAALREADAAASTSEGLDQAATSSLGAVSKSGGTSGEELAAAVKAAEALARARSAEVAAHQRAATLLSALSASRDAAARACVQKLQQVQVTLQQLQDALQKAEQQQQQQPPLPQGADSEGYRGALPAPQAGPQQYVPVNAQPSHDYDAPGPSSMHPAPLASPQPPHQPPLPSQYSPSMPGEQLYAPGPDAGGAGAAGGGGQQGPDEIARIADLVTSLDANEAAKLIFGVITDTDESTRALFSTQMREMMTMNDTPPMGGPLDLYDPSM